MSAIPIALAAALLAACGSSRPTDSSGSTTEPLGEPTDAGVPLGRPSQPGDAGAPELPPTVVRSSVLEAQRLTGDPHIEPDPDERSALAPGKTAGSVAVKYCVDGTGKVSAVRILKSSGLPRYDQRIRRVIETWTYRPVVVEGQPAEVCTVTTFIYRAPPAPPPP